jgi:lipopolysaccharide transport system ATP-binding protein
LRVYSTGMQMRLAFSAATVIRPEILIVDEALAVGDAYFQHKCIQRIRSFQEDGTTLLFVSHDPGVVKALCKRGLLFDEGNLINDDQADAVLNYYNAMIARKNKDEEIQQIETQSNRVMTRSGTGEASILKVELLNEKNQPARGFQVGEPAKIVCQIGINTYLENLNVGILIRDRLGNDVFGTNTLHLNSESKKLLTGDNLEIEFKTRLNLGNGSYSLSVAVHSGDTHLAGNYDWWDQCQVFQVIPGNSFDFIGVASLPLDVMVKKERSR